MLKSLSTQFALALLLGPVGLVYSSIAGAVFLSLVLAVLYFTDLGEMAVFIVWPLSIITGLVFVKLHNDRMRSSGSRLLLGPGEDGDLISTAGSWGRGLTVLSLMAVGGYLAFVYMPSLGGSKIGRIVDAAEAPNEVASKATKEATTPAIEIGVEEETGKATLMTLEEQIITPVVIDTSSGPDEVTGAIWYVDVEVVNVRSGPSTDNSILVQLDRGEELSEFGRDGKWINVTVAKTGVNGWVFDQLVSGAQQ